MNIRTLTNYVLSILGFTFLFFLGFPFGNHNESYLMVVQLKGMSLLDVLTKQVQPVVNFRPLGNALAWITFEISSGKIYLQQLFNWLLALVAWSIVFFSSKEKAFFSIIAFVVGFAFFPGYIYLFHLHGVFYSPLLIYISILIFLSSRPHTSLRDSIILFLLTLFISLFHPYALFIYAFFLIGLSLELFKESNYRPVRTNAILFFLTIIAYRFLLPSFQPNSITTILNGFLATYQMVEINKGISVIVYILSILALSTIDMPKRRLLSGGVILTILSLIFIFYHIPVLLLWIGTVFIKSSILRNWRLTSIILSCTVFSIASGTGSPTYSVFILMVCSYATTFRFVKFEEFLLAHIRIPYLFICTLIVLFCFLKSGVNVPIISKLLNPVQAEQEKTQQLETIIKWYQNSTFPPKKLTLFDAAENPSSSSNAIDRKHRPPTNQQYLDVFMQNSSPLAISNDPSLLYITFGDEYITNKKVIFSVPGRWNGSALVFQ
jgi:hypothetical protein